MKTIHKVIVFAVASLATVVVGLALVNRLKAKFPSLANIVGA